MRVGWIGLSEARADIAEFGCEALREAEEADFLLWAYSQRLSVPGILGPIGLSRSTLTGRDQTNRPLRTSHFIEYRSQRIQS
jgi:hypothetical protein